MPMVKYMVSQKWLLQYHHYEPYHEYSAKSQLPTYDCSKDIGQSPLRTFRVPIPPQSFPLPGNNSSINHRLDQALDQWTSWLARTRLRWTEMIFGALLSLLAHIIKIFFFCSSQWQTCQKYFPASDGQDYQAALRVLCGMPTDKSTFSMRRQKQKLINSPKSMKQFGRWPRKRLSRPLQTPPHRHRLSEPEGNSWIKPHTFKIKESQAQKWLEMGALPTFLSRDVFPLPWSSSHLKSSLSLYK